MTDVNDWTVGDVTQWLNSVMLGQYASTFAANEITGPILLDISLEGSVSFTLYQLHISNTVETESCFSYMLQIWIIWVYQSWGTEKLF